jgi:sulfur carrier protein
VEICVNGESREVPEGITVEGLLELLGVARRRIAVAVNRNVVPRTGYVTHQIGAGDHVEILQAVGGGS